MREIEFISNKNVLPEYLPLPCIKFLPNWFLTTSLFKDNREGLRAYEDGLNTTIKHCVPILDTVYNGYYILTENDIWVDQKDNKPTFLWKLDGTTIKEHSLSEIGINLIEDNYFEIPYSFISSWGIKTPPGYSSFILHPMNDVEMPFRCMSAIVDTDTYNLPLNFAFFIKKDFVGLIPAGTPIVKVMPFKRDSWKMKISQNKKLENQARKFNSLIYRSYRNQFWSPKKFT